MASDYFDDMDEDPAEMEAWMKRDEEWQRAEMGIFVACVKSGIDISIDDEYGPPPIVLYKQAGTTTWNSFEIVGDPNITPEEFIKRTIDHINKWVEEVHAKVGKQKLP